MRRTYHLFSLVLALGWLFQMSHASLPDPSGTVQELRNERQEMLRGRPVSEYREVDALIAEKANGFLAAYSKDLVTPGNAMGWAGLQNLAGNHDEALGALLLVQEVSMHGEDPWPFALELLLTAARARRGDVLASVLLELEIPDAHAATLASHFGGSFHHHIFNAQGAAVTLEILERIAARQPSGPFPTDDIRKQHGWAMRQLADAQAFYLAELGRFDEAVAVLEHALETLDEDIHRKEALRGSLQRYKTYGQTAPELAVLATHGEFPDLQSLHGRPVLLQFTAHWCHACHAAIPSMLQLRDDFQESGLTLISVTTYYGFFRGDRSRTRDMPPEEEFARMPQLLDEKGIDWPMVYTDRESLQRYGVSGIPQFVLFDPEGRIVKIDTGYSPEKMDRFRILIQKMLAGTLSS